MSSSEKKSLILVSNDISVTETKNYRGTLVPWEVQSYQKDFEIAQTQGGLFDLSFHAVVEIRGKDAQDYLQRMTTVQLKNLDRNCVAHGAFLNGRGGVIALAVFRRIASDAFQIIVLQALKQKLMDHIEMFHFSESFTVHDVSPDWTVFGCWSPNGKLASQFGISSHLRPLESQFVTHEGIHFEVWRDVRRGPLFWILLRAVEAPTFIQNCLRFGHFILGLHLYEYFRIQSGVPDSDEELSEKDIILEGNFDEAVARNKGCYPGQEVVERIFTYGQVNRKLLRVNLVNQSEAKIPLPQLIEQDQKEVGILVSVEPDPIKYGEAVGLMFVKKEFWSSKDSWSILPGGQVSLAV